ncbi:MAG: twin-arginine translocase subunit TatC [Calditrichaeota bacterium]|nr:twin-arginine translocase subunit TatC [Calditrichota bacterium]
MPGGAPEVKSNRIVRKTMGFLEHLEELRLRLIRAILFIAAGTALSLYFSEHIIQFLISPASKSELIKLALLNPTEGFIVHLKASFVAGLFLTSPFWFAQLWGFISPGLYKNEKRIITPVIFFSAAAFLIGAGFGWQVIPFATEYFASFTVGKIETHWSLASYVNFVLQFLLAFGIVFELPLFIYAAARLGIVTPSQLRRYRRHSIVAILIVAGIITPPDVFSQIIVGVPLYLLYEVGILASMLAHKRRENKEPFK